MSCVGVSLDLRNLKPRIVIRDDARLTGTAFGCGGSFDGSDMVRFGAWIVDWAGSI
jgi:hypothetical protein